MFHEDGEILTLLSSMPTLKVSPQLFKCHKSSGEEGASLQFTLCPKFCLPNKEASVCVFPLCWEWAQLFMLTNFSNCCEIEGKNTRSFDDWAWILLSCYCKRILVKHLAKISHIKSNFPVDGKTDYANQGTPNLVGRTTQGLVSAANSSCRVTRATLL